MQKKPHIIVIGAGLIGLSTADSLVQRGAKVTVIDKKAGPGLGTSHCNSGMIHPSQAWPWHRPDMNIDTVRQLVDLGNQSRRYIKSRMKALGLADAARVTGTIQFFDSEDRLQQAQAKYESIRIKTRLLADHSWTFGRPALEFPDDFSGNAYEYCVALEADLKRKSVEFVYACEDIAIHAPRLSVQAKDQKIAADHIVVAAGMGSQALLKQVGQDIGLKPVPGHALCFVRPNIPLPKIPIMDERSHSALTVFSDQVRLSGTVGEHAPDVLLSIWQDIAPDLISGLGKPIKSWTGDRPVLPAGEPLIGRTICDGVWVNTGHGHMGWTLCAGSAEKLAEMILSA